MHVVELSYEPICQLVSERMYVCTYTVCGDFRCAFAGTGEDAVLLCMCMHIVYARGCEHDQATMASNFKGQDLSHALTYGHVHTQNIICSTDKTNARHLGPGNLLPVNGHARPSCCPCC